MTTTDVEPPPHFWTLQPQFRRANGFRYHGLSLKNPHRTVCGKRLRGNPYLFGGAPSSTVQMHAEVFGDQLCLRCVRRLRSELPD
jgi:hypothetical protein